MRAPPWVHRSGDTRRSRIAFAAIALSGGVPGAGGKGGGTTDGGELSTPMAGGTGATPLGGWLGLNPTAREGPLAGTGVLKGGMTPPCTLVGGGMPPSTAGGTVPGAAALELRHRGHL